MELNELQLTPTEFRHDLANAVVACTVVKEPRVVSL